MFWYFGREACGILDPTGIEPTAPESEGEVSTTGPPGKSPFITFLNYKSKLYEIGFIEL